MNHQLFWRVKSSVKMGPRFGVLGKVFTKNGRAKKTCFGKIGRAMYKPPRYALNRKLTIFIIFEANHQL